MRGLRLESVDVLHRFAMPTHPRAARTGTQHNGRAQDIGKPVAQRAHRIVEAAVDAHGGRLIHLDAEPVCNRAPCCRLSTQIGCSSTMSSSRRSFTVDIMLVGVSTMRKSRTSGAHSGREMNDPTATAPVFINDAPLMCTTSPDLGCMSSNVCASVRTSAPGAEMNERSCPSLITSAGHCRAPCS